MAEIGFVIDERYRIIRKIAAGGMSQVYLALDLRLGKNWAVKEIPKTVADTTEKITMKMTIRQTGAGNGTEIPKQDVGKREKKAAAEAAVKAARTETEMISSLNHPRIVRIVDFIETDDAVYVVEDYIEGTSLKETAALADEIPEAVIAGWGIEICRILRYLHSQTPPIIYRDVKPENFIRTKNGLMIIDFGIARRFKPGKASDTVSLGTVKFAAPEQYEENGTQTDMRTDIYGLGATMLYLSGKCPDLSRKMKNIIGKCTRSKMAERYKCVDEVITELMKIRRRHA